MSLPALDSRIAEGMALQKELLQQRLALGERLIGWKVGFGSPTGLAQLQTAGPLVGFLTDGSEAPSGAHADITGWTRPIVEPEIALYMGRPLGTDASESEARSAIAAIGPALELADVDRATDDIATILAGNIFHRRVVLGEPDPRRAGGSLEDLEAFVDGERVAETGLEENTGRIVDIALTVANTVPLLGQALEAGQVVIAGSIIPPLVLSPGQTVRFHLRPLAPLSLSGFERGAA